MYAKKMTPASPPLLLQGPTVSRMPSNKNSAVHTSCRGHHPFAFGVLLLLSTVLLFSSHGSDTEAAPSPTLARHGGCCVAFVGSFAGGYVGAASLGLGGRLCPRTLALVRRRNGRARISAQRRRGARMAAAGEKEEEKMELAAEVCPNGKQATNVSRSIRSQFARCLFTSGLASLLLARLRTRVSSNVTKGDYCTYR